MYLKSFLRAIGLRQGFRRGSGNSLLNIAVASGIGVISGIYIFDEPLKQYWIEQQHKQQQLQQEQQNGSNNTTNSASNTNNTTTTTTVTTNNEQ